MMEYYEIAFTSETSDCRQYENTLANSSLAQLKH